MKFTNDQIAALCDLWFAKNAKEASAARERMAELGITSQILADDPVENEKPSVFHVAKVTLNEIGRDAEGNLFAEMDFKGEGYCKISMRAGDSLDITLPQPCLIAYGKVMVIS